MTREVQDPTSQSTRHGIVSSHPAYGQIHAARVQGDAVLTGTDFVHHNFIKIEVQRSQLHRDLSRDWFHPTESVVEVCMSEAQWATFISSLNIGAGVPCTITQVGYKAQPGLPHRTQVSEFLSEMSETLRDAVGQIDDVIRALAGPGVTAKQREIITRKLRASRQEIVDNVPFVEKSFSKHVETTLEHAKVEVSAYVQGVISRAGLRSLTSGAPVELITDQTAEEVPNE